MAVIGLCTGTTADWQSVTGKLVLIERELGVEIDDDGYALIRQGNGVDDFFDLPIIVNNRRYEEILRKIEGYNVDASNVLDKVKELEEKAKTSADNAKASEDNAKISENNAKDSELNAKVSEDNAKNSEIKSTLSELNVADMYEKVKALAEQTIQNVVKTVFKVNFDTGNIEYTQGTHEFQINEATGEIEWRLSA